MLKPTGKIALGVIPCAFASFTMSVIQPACGFLSPGRFSPSVKKTTAGLGTFFAARILKASLNATP
jgi:hypothetical protein